MAHSVFHWVSRFLTEAARQGYQGELEIISFLILAGLAAGACGLAVILLIHSI